MSVIDEWEFPEELPSDLTWEQRKYLLFNNGFGALLTIVCVWMAYAIYVVFKFDIVRFLKFEAQPGPRELDLTTFEYLLVAPIITLWAMGYAALYIRRAFHLARHGVEIVADVTGVSWGSWHEWKLVYYEYWYEGELTQTRMACWCKVADQYAAGTKLLVLLCDPQKPCRSMLLSDVFKCDDELFEVVEAVPMEDSTVEV